MEFKFNINHIFKDSVVEINNNLIPPGFSGDRRALWDTIGKVSEIVNTMGEASAVAQGLSKPITTAERLRNSEHKLYFLIDQTANNGKGAVTGMLKTGNKGLYIFDRDGQHYQVTPPCILDFYIHESRQRTGLGKQLFEHMLQKNEITPVKMAIDRPSDKLLGFLNKHYSLNTPVKQMNNYVVFDGFFPKSQQPDVAESRQSGNLGRKESANGLQKFSSPQGRYGAPRPPCSMGQIIHNQSTNKNQEPTGVKSVPATNYQGVHHGGSYPVSQSTPNINMGQRILNDAYNQNLENLNYSNTNYILNNNAKPIYNSQNMQNVVSPNQELYRNHIPMETTRNIQQYNNNHSHSMYALHQNQNMTQQPQYNAQNVYPVNNNLQGTGCTNNYNLSDYQNITQSNQEICTIPKADNQSYLQQPLQYHSLQDTQQINNTQDINVHSNAVGSQVYVNNQQHQDQRNIMSPQHYQNVNQQFQALNLNDRMSLPNVATNNNISAQFSSLPPESYGVHGQHQIVAGPVEAISNKNIQQVHQQAMQNITGTQQILSRQNIIEPHLPSNQNIQSNNVTVSNLAQTPQLDNNMNQLHSYQQHNVSQSQILAPQQNANPIMPDTPNMTNTPHNMLNHISPRSVRNQPFTSETQQNMPLPPPYTITNRPGTYNQTYYPNQNLNSATSNEKIQYVIDNNKPCPQHSSDVQIARPYSARNISDVSKEQTSRHSIVNESGSALNNANQVSGDNAQGGNKSAYDTRGQEVNQNASDVQDDGEKPNISSKLERPQSLSIQKSEEEIGDIASNDKDCTNFENNVELIEIQDNLKTVKINEDTIPENLHSSETDDTASTKTPSHLTNQGYFDIKFYHNKLW